jgi:hypothetical protein
MVARHAALAALVACSVPEVDYTGKQCPCPAGYVCNQPTQTCARSFPGDGHSTDAPRTDAARDGTSVESCLSDAFATPAYTTTFADYSTAWAVGNGNWTATIGNLQQINSTVPFAYVDHALPGTNVAASYRLVGNMQDIGGSGTTTGAAGLAARIAEFSDDMYACVWDPVSGKLALQRVDGVLSITELGSVTATTAMTGGVTIELQVSGSSLACCLDVLPTMVVTATDTTYTSGAVGVATETATATFTELSAYTP